MQPARLRAALAGMVDASPAGALELPSDVGDGLSPEVRTRLNTFAAFVTADGKLALRAPAVEQTAAGAKVSGTAGCLGFPRVGITLEIGPEDAAKLVLTNPSGETLRIH